MRVNELIKVEVKINDVWVDYSDGTIDINIVRGIQEIYQNRYQQPGSGTLTLITRNIDFDPYENPSVQVNTDIRILADGEPIYVGRILRTNVSYGPKGKPPTITVLAVDMIGTMSRHIVRDNFCQRLGGNMDLQGFLQELTDLNGNGYPPASEWEIIGFEDGYSGPGTNGNIAAQGAGKTAYDLALLLANTERLTMYADKNNIFQFEYFKDVSPAIQFDSRGTGTSYRSIFVSDGFDSLLNQIKVTNVISGTGVDYDLYQNDFSVRKYGASQQGVDVVYSGGGYYAGPNLEIEQTSRPFRDVKNITFDATLAIDASKQIDLLDKIRVYHELDNFTINSEYDIVGIEHKITQNDWEITYNLKNSDIFTNFPSADIEVTPTVGDLNTAYEFTVNNLEELQNMDYDDFEWQIYNGLGYRETTILGTTATYTFNDSADAGDCSARFAWNNPYTGYGTQDYSEIFFQVNGLAPEVSFSTSAHPSNSALRLFAFTGRFANSYLWDFGDGSTSTLKNPAHVYAASNTYTVSLTCVNEYGTTTHSQPVVVTVPVGPSDEIGDFPVDGIFLYQPLHTSPTLNYFPKMRSFKSLTSETLTNRSADQGTGFEWNFSGLQYFQAIGDLSPTNTSSDTSYGLRPYKLSAGDTQWLRKVNTGGTQYDINSVQMELSGYTGEVDLDVYVKKPGITDPSIELDDYTKIGTFETSTLGVVQMVPIYNMPLSFETMRPSATFTYEYIYATDSYQFTYTGLPADEYLWDFGDGETSTEENPNHQYALGDTYTVTLAATNYYGTNETEQEIEYIKDEVGTRPVRYVLLKQDSYTTSDPKFMPNIKKFKGLTSATLINLLDSKPIVQDTYFNGRGLEGWWSPTYSTQLTGDITGTTNKTKMTTSTAPGIHTKPYGSTITEWGLVFDLGQTVYSLKDLYLTFTKDGSEVLTFPLPNYKVYVANTLPSANSLTGWTEVGTITAPSSLTTNTPVEVEMSPTVTMPPNL